MLILGIPWQEATCLVSIFVLFQFFKRPRRPDQVLLEEYESLMLLDENIMVSFLVAAWNASDRIPRFMEAFDKLTLPRKELILCCGGGDDTYIEALHFQKSNIIVIEQLPGQGKQGGLRAGFSYTRGDVIYLTDIDCSPSDNAVYPLIRRLTMDDEIVAVSGTIKPLPSQITVPIVRTQWAIERYRSLTNPKLTSGLRGANAVVWRDAIEETGSFSQEAISGTDYTLAKEILKHQRKIGFESKSEMPTEFPQSLREYASKQGRWLRNVVILGKKYEAKDEVRSIYQTFTLSVIPILCGLISLLWLPAIWFFDVLVIQMIINRYHYHRLSKISFSGAGVFESIIGDWGAVCTAIYQLVFKQFTW
ncbi:MAG: glycosyltransferase [Firmicutes bacterium]|nr:glycosyltransferase [Bacillota bacterium]